MPSMQRAVDRIYRDITRLSRRDKRSLLTRLMTELTQGTGDTSTRHTILEIQGVGKEIWEGVDGQEYVDGERSSWT